MKTPIRSTRSRACWPPALHEQSQLAQAIDAWFFPRGWKVFPFQRLVWRAALAGQSGLLHASTGAGKTYAVWFAALLRAALPGKRKAGGPRVLWIAPMRALAADTQRALEESAAALAPGWTIGARTGDTGSAERACQSRAMPSTLITTPESLSLLVSHADAQERCATLDMVIIDEARAKQFIVYANELTRPCARGNLASSAEETIRRCCPTSKETILKAAQKLLVGLMALMPLLSMTMTAAPAQAQQRTEVYAPVIRGFSVDEVRRLRPGSELTFNLYGTPGGIATLSIEGANRNLSLVETDPGQYEGTYTLGTRDRITDDSRVTANLRVGNLVASQVLSESLVRGVGYHPGRRADRGGRERVADMPRIERFDVQGNDDLSAGNELVFSVYGTPGAKVDMAISGARGVFFLPEVRPGEYTGGYTIRRRDRIEANSVVTANMRYGDRVATATLGKPLLMTAAAPAPRAVRYCSNCATVEAVNVVEVSGDGNYLGTIGGGVVGALLGSQVGKGSGKTAAQVAGAVGGAYVGRNIERNARKTQHYEVLVRYINGGTQTVTYENDPGLRVGEKVKVDNGVLTRDQ